MATPTTNKGYLVPTLNSDFNVWGSEVNGNYAIQDLNLGGVQSISVAGSSNVTATTSEAQYLLTVLTGILTGNIEYILPAVGGLYVIGNATTGAFSLTVACAGGGATFAIPQGQYMTLVCDGTNIVSATSAYVLNSASISVTAITATSGFIVPNSVAYQSKDSGGTIRSMLEYNVFNSVVNFSGTNNWAVVKSDGSAVYLSIDNTTGAATFLEGVLFSLGFTVPNNQTLLVKDSGGTPHSFFVMGTDNNSYMEVGPGGYWTVTTSGGAAHLFQIGTAGATFYGGVTAASLTISGAAAFATIPTIPDAPAADSSIRAANTEWTLANTLGGTAQSWQSPGRALNTVYTNSTGRPISVVVGGYLPTGSYNAVAVVSGVTVGACGSNSSANDFFNFSFIVPAGAVYELVATVVNGLYWSELR